MTTARHHLSNLNSFFMAIMNNFKTIALNLIQGVLFKFALHRKIIKK